MKVNAAPLVVDGDGETDEATQSTVIIEEQLLKAVFVLAKQAKQKDIDKNKEINEIFGELEGWDTDWALPRNGEEDDAGEDDSSEEKDGGEEKDNNGEEEQKEEHAVATLDGEEKLSDALHRVTPEV